MTNDSPERCATCGERYYGWTVSSGPGTTVRCCVTPLPDGSYHTHPFIASTPEPVAEEPSWESADEARIEAEEPRWEREKSITALWKKQWMGYSETVELPIALEAAIAEEARRELEAEMRAVAEDLVEAGALDDDGALARAYLRVDIALAPTQGGEG